MQTKLPFFNYLQIKSPFQLHSSSTENNSDSLNVSSLFPDNFAHVFWSNL